MHEIPQWQTEPSMSTDSVSKNLRLKKHDGLWLAMALVLHALLLLIPLQPATLPDLASRSVSITLQSFIPTERIEGPPGSPVEVESTPPPAVLPLVDTSPLPTEPLPNQAETPAATESATPPIITAAQLIDSAQQFKWVVPEADKTRQLGVFRPQTIPENWRPKITREDNLFNGMMLPEKTEVMDRWLTADGSQHVVIETTTGHTLCGMRRMWDPMNPLLEQVMMFRPCAGGGKRKIKNL